MGHSRNQRLQQKDTERCIDSTQHSIHIDFDQAPTVKHRIMAPNSCLDIQRRRKVADYQKKFNELAQCFELGTYPNEDIAWSWLTDTFANAVKDGLLPYIRDDFINTVKHLKKNEKK